MSRVQRGSSGLIVALALLACQQAGATTRALPSGTQSDPVGTPAGSPHCEVSGEFVEASHVAETIVFKGNTYQETRVSWAIDIAARASVSGGACPGGTRFELSIRGAEYANIDGAGQYVYPPHVREPAPKTRVTALVRQVHVRDPRNGAARDEWLVTDWEKGFVPAQD